MEGEVRERRRSRRARWWEAGPPDTAAWYLAEPPAELREALAAGELPEGPALDIGCGPGVATRELAGRFELAVGVDLALGAVRLARAWVRESPPGRARPPAFVVARAPRLPFGPERFAFVFDRGVLHHVPRAGWPAYFAEVGRVMAPGGRYVQLCPRRGLPPPFSYPGVRARLGRIRHGRPGPAMLRALPASMEALELREIPFSLPGGEEVTFTYGLFAKRPSTVG